LLIRLPALSRLFDHDLFRPILAHADGVAL
jgi:hypothetical protein